MPLSKDKEWLSTIAAMTFFSDRPRAPRGSLRWITLSLALITFGSLALLPTGYVIERPGQVFNVMGEVNGEPVISASNATTYPSQSQFDVTTVSLLGNREATPSWFQILLAWADPHQIVLPLDEVFPANRTTEEIRAESTMQMEVSQQDAIAAALLRLGHEVPRQMYVASVIADAPSSGILVAGDFVKTANGEAVATFDGFKSKIQSAGGGTVVVGVERDGQFLEFEIAPQDREGTWVIGAMIGYTYDFPVDIQLQLGDVGGPSGGLMFTLGILDALEQGDLAGANHVAGTGTISADGMVGPIGGIQLKMIAAAEAGADLFLVPIGNCNEAIGQVPEGLPVVSVRDLDEAVTAVEQLKSGSTFPNLTCDS